MASARHALIVGIDRYPKIEGANLRGCTNDAKLMRSLMVGRFGFADEKVEVLLDHQATRDGILAGLDRLTGRAGENDVVLFFFAGHGSRMSDPREGAETGAMIESLVPHDSGRGELPNRDILDEEVDRWVQALNQTTPFVSLVMDCCHSGSVTRDPFAGRTREVPVDTRDVATRFGPAGGPSVLRTTRSAPGGESAKSLGWRPGRRDAVVLAACRADEYANEHRFFDGEGITRHGAMTFFLGGALRKLSAATTWRDLFEHIAPQLSAAYASQHPHLEGKVDELLFGTVSSPPAAYLRVLGVDGERIELAGGAAHDVAVGARWSIRGHGARHRGAGDEVASVAIVSVGAASSWAERVDGAAGERPVEPGQRAFLVEQAIEPSLRVAMTVPAERKALAATLRDLVAEATMLTLEDDPARADVMVYALAPRADAANDDPVPGLGALRDWTWAGVGRDGRLAVRLRTEEPSSGRPDLEALVTDLVRVARFERVLAIENPDPTSRLGGTVAIRLLRRQGGEMVPAVPDPASGFVVFRSGDKADITLTNRGDTPVRVSLVQFGADRKIEIMMPRNGHPTFQLGGEPGSQQGGFHLAPGETQSVADYYRQDPRFARAVTEGLPLHLPAGFPWAAEPGDTSDVGMLYLKAMVTPEPADFAFLEQPGARPSLSHPLQALSFACVSGQGKRSMIPDVGEEPAMDWATVTAAIGIRR